jgi:hypothetical protein
MDAMLHHPPVRKHYDLNIPSAPSGVPSYIEGTGIIKQKVNPSGKIKRKLQKQCTNSG